MVNTKRGKTLILSTPLLEYVSKHIKAAGGSVLLIKTASLSFVLFRGRVR